MGFSSVVVWEKEMMMVLSDWHHVIISNFISHQVWQFILCCSYFLSLVIIILIHLLLLFPPFFSSVWLIHFCWSDRKLINLLNLSISWFKKGKVAAWCGCGWMTWVVMGVEWSNTQKKGKRGRRGKQIKMMLWYSNHQHLQNKNQSN